jgi:hypothetical protein
LLYAWIALLTLAVLLPIGDKSVAVVLATSFQHFAEDRTDFLFVAKCCQLATISIAIDCNRLQLVAVILASFQHFAEDRTDFLDCQPLALDEFLFGILLGGCIQHTRLPCE